MTELSHPAFEDETRTPWPHIALWSAVVATLAMLAAPWLCYTPLMVALVASIVAIFASLKALGTPNASSEARHMAAAGFVLGAASLALLAIVGLFIGAYAALILASVISAV